MSKEDNLLDKIFGIKEIKWKDKYPISYCDMCQTWIISCDTCLGTTCNGHGGACEECHEDFKNLDDLKAAEHSYLNDDEIKTWKRIRRLHKFIKWNLEQGNKQINWRNTALAGICCDSDYKLFDELKPFKKEAEEHWDKELKKDKENGGFVFTATHYAEAGEIDKALDIIYEGIDTLMARGQHKTISDIISSLDPKEVDLDICLAVLSSSLPVAELTSGRKELINGIREELIKKGENPDRVLIGIV